MKATDAKLLLENCPGNTEGRYTLTATTDNLCGGDVVKMRIKRDGKQLCFGLNDVYIDSMIDFLTYVRNRKRPRQPIKIADPHVTDNNQQARHGGCC